MLIKTHTHLATWRQRMDWSKDEAARQLGIARRKYFYLEAGTRDGTRVGIGRDIALACLALEELPATQLKTAPRGVGARAGKPR